MSADNAAVLLRTLAFGATAIALIAPGGTLLAWLLARRSFPGKSLFETLVLLPLVLPPVATGFLLLRALGRRSAIGGWLERHVGLEIAFHPAGAVVAMAAMALPLFLITARVAIQGVDPRLELVARTLGASQARVLATVTLPLAARGLAGAALLAWARAMGEFGATILLAGAIPGRTETMAVAIYQRIQLGRDAEATMLLLASLGVAFVTTVAAEWLMGRGRAGR